MIGSNLQPARANERGFALFIAIILSAVAVMITLSLTTLAYKNLLLSSDARDSGYAFYSADSALQCVLNYDKAAVIQYSASTPSSYQFTCGAAGVQVTLTGTAYDAHTDRFLSGWFTANGSRCARITVYKTDGTIIPSATYYTEGVNVACSSVSTDPRAVERGLKASD
jgi:Tfp pilus assembly protein PilX